LFLSRKDSGSGKCQSENIEEVYQIHVHIIEYLGIPVIIPFPDENVEQDSAVRELEVLAVGN
jgi:hypothetical protein